MQPKRIPALIEVTDPAGWFDRFWDEVAVAYGACQEALDWRSTHGVKDMLDDSIPEPYLPEWGYWTYMKCAQHGDKDVRMIILQAACKSPFIASQIWQKADHATPEERAYAYAVASKEFAELKKAAERGEITAGSRAHEFTKAVPVEGSIG